METDTLASNASVSRTKRPVAFLDTNVIVSYLKGKGSATRLFDPDLLSHVRYAINPVVMQELLVAGDKDYASRSAELVKEKKLEVLALDQNKIESVLPRARNLRNRLAHSNDILIFSSALGCDYLVTEDQGIAMLAQEGAPTVVSVDELLRRVLGQS